jgi:hypothetical protein
MRLLVTTIVVLASTSANSGQLCNNVTDRIAAGFLYEAEHGSCSSADCLTRVTPNSNLLTGKANVELKAGRAYDFFYRTEETPIVNSVVAIQLKYIDTVPRQRELEPVGVNLERDATVFACSKDERRPYKYVQIVDGKEIDGAVDYDNYDRYHRWGRLATDDDVYCTKSFTYTIITELRGAASVLMIPIERRYF